MDLRPRTCGPSECWDHKFPGLYPSAQAFGTELQHGLKLTLLGNEFLGSFQLCVCFLFSWSCVTALIYETVSCETMSLLYTEEGHCGPWDIYCAPRASRGESVLDSRADAKGSGIYL